MIKSIKIFIILMCIPSIALSQEKDKEDERLRNSCEVILAVINHRFSRMNEIKIYENSVTVHVSQLFSDYYVSKHNAKTAGLIVGANAIENWHLVNQKSYSLKPILNKLDNIKVLGDKSKNELGYGYILISRIGFNENYTAAFIYVSMASAWGEYYLLTKTVSGWMVNENLEFPFWIH